MTLPNLQRNDTLERVREARASARARARIMAMIQRNPQLLRRLLLLQGQNPIQVQISHNPANVQMHPQNQAPDQIPQNPANGQVPSVRQACADNAPVPQ